MEPEQVRKLLWKFYSGKTSLEEERLLRNYFLSENVPEEFTADRIYFRYFAEVPETEKPASSFLRKLDKIIDERYKEPVYKRGLRPVIAWSISIAASVLILAGAYFAWYRQSIPDTYNNPEEAYQKTRKVLLYVSQQLNRGTSEMYLLNYAGRPAEEIQKVKQATRHVNDLKYLNHLSMGMDKIKELQSLTDAGQVLGKYIRLNNNQNK